MRVEQIPAASFFSLLSEEGLRIRLGPFNVRISTNLRHLAEQLHFLYAHYELVEDEITEFHVKIVSKRSIPRPFSASVHFLVDDQEPFPPAPVNQALAILEWGINLAIALRTNHLLLFHSAAVERNGNVLLLPAWPGSGKTTLCTVLAHRGFRLFSDEFGLMDTECDELLPVPRLMSLKNQSIDVIKRYLPEAAMGQAIPHTQKGTVAHVRPPQESIEQSAKTAKARWIIFPKWVADSPLRLERLPQSEAFLLLASNSFNYEILGEAAYKAVTRLVKTCHCYKLVYSDFDRVLTALNELTDGG
ncbi:HprK-related kinase A [Nitrosomonas nitrosa]|uniref:Hpr(Ser) kinase/phosphatase n=1 Tax=Nitrosomonas nitrosa TaxID=52442 RepID=A0A1I4Q9T2_9PROT|nr:HprK-related kinase A [Nitrosomonas nitrosa]MCO6433942.1 HprK-related kinase A [Nitrosomonas nitrosa]SFM36851.1 Hpr(Ser) kinase/phosphatase [Nitrosomonas nitrosa]